MLDQPLVTVVTPVYNGIRFIAANIESVRRQTYGRFEHVVLDNASNDGTGPFLDARAAEDPRIRIFRNQATVPVGENWNRAIRKISPESRWCVVLPADDTLHPQFLQRMLEVATHKPGVGVVGSLLSRGGQIECQGLPRERSVFPGSEIVQLFLRQEAFILSPGGSLLGMDLVRRYDPFFPPEYLHSDVVALLRMLPEADFGFVHEVLYFPGVHEGSITVTRAARNQTFVLEWLWFLQRFGPRVFEPAELAELIEAHRRHHYRVLVRGMATGRGMEFLNYHRQGLAEAGLSPSPLDLLRAVGENLLTALGRPKHAWRYLNEVVIHRDRLSQWNMTTRL